jgi:hypothetical protein
MARIEKKRNPGVAFFSACFFIHVKPDLQFVDAFCSIVMKFAASMNPRLVVLKVQIRTLPMP